MLICYSALPCAGLPDREVDQLQKVHLNYNQNQQPKGEMLQRKLETTATEASQSGQPHHGFII